MSIKVVDLQTEAIKEEPTIEEEEKVTNEDVDASPEARVLRDQTNEEVKQEVHNEEVKGKVKEEAKEEVKKPVRAQDRIVTCPKCDKSMKRKSYRYSHEQNCKGGLENKPARKHTTPCPKQQRKPKPKPPPEVYYSDDEEEEQTTHKPLSKPVRNQILKPHYINPQTAFAQHYQLLQQQLIKQKQEKYNNLCMNMFSSKSKQKRN